MAQPLNKPMPIAGEVQPQFVPPPPAPRVDARAGLAALRALGQEGPVAGPTPMDVD